MKRYLMTNQTAFSGLTAVGIDIIPVEVIDGTWCKYEDYIAERAKDKEYITRIDKENLALGKQHIEDKEEIASLKSAYVALEIKYESVRLTCKQTDEEIARLRNALIEARMF